MDDITKDKLDAKLIGKNIRTLRKYNNNETQLSLALSIRVDSSYIGKWENGQMPTKDNIERIAEYYHITVDDLISQKITYSFLDSFYKPIPMDDYDVKFDKIFLIFTSREAKNNEDFKIANELYAKNFTNVHKKLKSYKNIASSECATLQDLVQDTVVDGMNELLEDINSCRNYYYRSFKNTGILAGAANTLSMLLLEHIFTSFLNICTLSEISEISCKIINNQVSNSDFSMLFDKVKRTKNENALAFVIDNDDIYMECLKALRNDIKTIDIYEYFLLCKYMFGFIYPEINLDIIPIALMMDFYELGNRYIKTLIEYFDLSTE